MFRALIRFLLWFLGGSLAFASGLFFLVALVAFIATGHGFEDDEVLGTFIAGVGFAVPAIALMVALRKTRRPPTAQRNQVLGFIRSREQFSIADVAGVTGLPQPEADALVQRLIAEERLALEFRAESRSYHPRSGFEQGKVLPMVRGDVPERPAPLPITCRECGAPVSTEPGANVSHFCAVCGASLTHPLGSGRPRFN